MTTNSRNGFRWTVNEILSLQREFELLELTIDEIAQKHKRTTNAIMYKLDEEGFADYNVLYSNYYNLNSSMNVNKKSNCDVDFLAQDDDSDTELDDDVEDSDVEDLSLRVYGLESSVNEIKVMIKKMMNSLTNNNALSSLGF